MICHSAILHLSIGGDLLFSSFVSYSIYYADQTCQRNYESQLNRSLEKSYSNVLKY